MRPIKIEIKTDLSVETNFFKVSISTEISQLSRHTFWRCRDFLDCQDALFDNVETLDRDRFETNRDPQALFWYFKELTSFELDQF